MGSEIAEVKVNVDLLNEHHLINPQSEAGQEFSKFMSGIAEKLFAKNPEQQASFQNYDISFCLKDSKDMSIARVVNAEYPMDPMNLDGDKFVVMFSKDLLGSLKSEDEIAFVLGHELSHIFYNHNEHDIRSLHINEEAACDFNSLRLMNGAGMDLRAADKVDELYPQKSREQLMRQEERKRYSIAFFNYAESTPFDGSRFAKALFTKTEQTFKFPTNADSEDVQYEKILGNLKKVSEYGDRDGFRKKFSRYLLSKGSEQASKFVVNLMAKVTEEFPPIDAFKKAVDYRKYLNHPVNVMADVAANVGRMEGKKLCPPQSAAKVNRYFENNPNFYKGMEFAWEKLFKPEKTFPIGRGGDSRG